MPSVKHEMHNDSMHWRRRPIVETDTKVTCLNETDVGSAGSANILRTRTLVLRTLLYLIFHFSAPSVFVSLFADRLLPAVTGA